MFGSNPVFITFKLAVSSLQGVYSSGAITVQPQEQ